MKVVIHTNVFVGALQKNDGVNRAIFEMIFRNQIKPLMGDVLYIEYMSLLGREYLYENAVLDASERGEFFNALCSVCEWTEIYYKWRPNLRDEGDNHVIELGLAGNASQIISWNKRDFKGGDLMMPDIAIVTPVEFLKMYNNGEKTWQL